MGSIELFAKRSATFWTEVEQEPDNIEKHIATASQFIGDIQKTMDTVLISEEDIYNTLQMIYRCVKMKMEDLQKKTQ
jgi:hypothetical protein